MNGVVTFFAASGSAVAIACSALAQAPASAQVWDVRFIVDASGPFAAGPTATQVGITMYARLGILPNSSASGTNNLGIYRLGGASGILSWSFHDPLAASQALSEGTLQRGRTSDVDGRSFLDTNGAPLAGHFSPYRGTFNPMIGPLFLGANDFENNGLLTNPAIGSLQVSQLIGQRPVNVGSDGTGPVGVAVATDADPANLVGDLAPVYRLYYFPNESISSTRLIQVAVTGLSGRYAYAPSTFGGYSGASAVPIPDQSLTFVVPSPGSAALLAFACMAVSRRRAR